LQPEVLEQLLKGDFSGGLGASASGRGLSRADAPQVPQQELGRGGAHREVVVGVQPEGQR